MEKETKNTIIALLAHVIVLGFVVMLEKAFHYGHVKLIISILLVTAILIIFLLNINRIIAHVKQYFIAKIRGYWSGERLNKQIKKYFNASEEIKIKVTRGSIFADENNEFYKCIINKNNYITTNTKIKILLHYPCQNSSHIITRAKAHAKEETEYLAKLYKIIFKLLEAKQNHNLSLTIRLYGDQQIKWRYYIFAGAKSKTLFLGYYNDQTQGNLTPMIRIRGSKNDKPEFPTLCDDFDKAFDYTFQHKSLDIEEILNSELKARKDCLECLREDNSCEQCHREFTDKIKVIKETFAIN